MQALEIEWSTMTAGLDLTEVLSSSTVSLVQPGLTLRDVGAKREELLRHLDLLDVRQGVVTFPVYRQWDRI